MSNADKPAFPNDGMLPEGAFGWMNGLTKRELVAAMAMQGLLANAGGPIQANGMSGWGLVNCKAEVVADVAINLTDALLAKLDEKKEGEE